MPVAWANAPGTTTVVCTLIYMTRAELMCPVVRSALHIISVRSYIEGTSSGFSVGSRMSREKRVSYEILYGVRVLLCFVQQQELLYYKTVALLILGWLVTTAIRLFALKSTKEKVLVRGQNGF